MIKEKELLPMKSVMESLQYYTVHKYCIHLNKERAPIKTVNKIIAAAIKGCESEIIDKIDFIITERRGKKWKLPLIP